VIKAEQLQHLIEHPSDNISNDKALAQTLYREANDLSFKIQDRTEDTRDNSVRPLIKYHAGSSEDPSLYNREVKEWAYPNSKE